MTWVFFVCMMFDNNVCGVGVWAFVCCNTKRGRERCTVVFIHTFDTMGRSWYWIETYIQKWSALDFWFHR